MTSHSFITGWTGARSRVSALALGSAIAFGAVAAVTTADIAFADDSSHSGGSGSSSHADGSSSTDHADDHDDSHSGGFKGKRSDAGSGGHDDDSHDDSHDDSSHSGGRKGGSDDDTSGQDAQKGKGADRAGGKPPWAQEGIPEIELGRLNVARAPSYVLDRAYLEALSNFSADKVAFYNMSIDEAAAALRTNFDNVQMLDAPLQNLSLLRDILEDGDSVLNTLDQVKNDSLTLAAIFLGTASDKSVPVEPETAYALSVILGYELTKEQATALAKDAEIIRAAIAEGHG